MAVIRRQSLTGWASLRLLSEWPPCSSNLSCAQCHDERARDRAGGAPETLVAVGAPPSALARMAGARAWIISTTGGLIAVPLGWVMLWTILRAAGKDSPFPTLTAVMVAVAIPIVVAVGAVVASRVAQAARPITASTMSLD